MLSQRMAAATCLAISGVDATARAEVAWMSHMDFSAALSGLRHGNENLQLPAEDDAGILSALDAVERTWSSVGPAVQQLSSGDLHTVVMSQLLDGNLPLLTLSNAAVSEIVDRYGKDVIDPTKAKTINMAGRQRMLSQKMMKEACFVASELELDANLSALEQTIDLFDRSLTQLREGDPVDGVMPPPNAEVARQLDLVATLWSTYRVGLSVVEPGSRSGSDALSDLAHQSDAILREMHKAVLLYVAASD